MYENSYDDAMEIEFISEGIVYEREKKSRYSTKTQFFSTRLMQTSFFIIALFWK
jgi:hypothetical protein